MKQKKKFAETENLILFQDCKKKRKLKLKLHIKVMIVLID